MERKFLTVLKAYVQQISGENRTIRIKLMGGGEYFAKVLDVQSDYFVLDVHYPGGGTESIAIRFDAVAAASLT